MRTFRHFKERVIHIDKSGFNDLAMELFHYQAIANPVYSSFIGYLGLNLKDITQIDQIPFMPVDFFKHHKVICGGLTSQKVYESSGTTGQLVSKNYVADTEFYLQHAASIFQGIYGSLKNYHVLALLPNYLERGASSLVDMVSYFISLTGDKYSGFYLDDHGALRERIAYLSDHSNRKILLLGVSFALLDLAEEGNFPQSTNLLVMETGGMKGRRKELLREELHEILMKAFSVDAIHSEYGMTETLSQAYSTGQSLFTAPPTMQIRLRDPNDPLDLSNTVKRGAVNLVDLANIHSCAFLQLSDLAECGPDGQFRVLGRMDNSDIRGCNLMVQ